VKPERQKEPKTGVTGCIPVALKWTKRLFGMTCAFNPANAPQNIDSFLTEKGGF
jgi:hypothetical protein